MEQVPWRRSFQVQVLNMRADKERARVEGQNLESGSLQVKAFGQLGPVFDHAILQ